MSGEVKDAEEATESTVNLGVLNSRSLRACGRVTTHQLPGPHPLLTLTQHRCWVLNGGLHGDKSTSNPWDPWMRSSLEKVSLSR